MLEYQFTLDDYRVKRTTDLIVSGKNKEEIEADFAE